MYIFARWIVNKNKIFAVLSFIVLTLGWFTMAYSRFILGLHSFNQLLYGVLLGVWSLYMNLSWFNPLVAKTVEHVKENGWTGGSSKKYFIIAAIITLITQVAVIIAHYSINYNL